MPHPAPHDTEHLTRYAFGDLVGGERTALERHFEGCAPCRDFVSFVREFNTGLREAGPPSEEVDEPCPDSPILIALEAEELDEVTAQHVRAHMVFCELCQEEFDTIARARPKGIDAFLRVARGLVEALRVKGGAVWEVNPVSAVTRGGEEVYAAPFRVTETLADPDTGVESTVVVHVESIPDGDDPEAGSVRVVVESDPVVRVWKAHLFDSDEASLASIPLGEPQVEIDTGLPYGFYAVEIRKDEECLGRFTFTIEPFSLPEAVEAALGYLDTAHYGRALAILESAAERYPESKEVWDLRCLARGLAAADPEGFEREREEVGQVRGDEDFAEETRQILEKVKVRFGEDAAYVLTAATLDPSALPEDAASRLKEEKPSLMLLRAIEILSRRLKPSDDRVATLLGDLASRPEEVPGLLTTVQQGIEDIRREVRRNVDEKFEAATRLLERLEKDIRTRNVSLPDYELDFRERLGEACWQWMGLDAQKIVVSAEGLHWYFGSQPALAAPDFSPAILQLCRGFELLLNEKIRELCTVIWNTVRPRRELLDLMNAQHPSFEPDKAFKLRETISLGQFSTILRVGRVVEEAKPGTFGKPGALLTASPGLTDVECLVPLAYVGTVFRNGVVHPIPGSPRNFKTAEEMQLLRKLIFGLDERRVPGRDVLSYAENALWFSRDERKEARRKLSAAWREYPGLVKMLWRVLQALPQA